MGQLVAQWEQDASEAIARTLNWADALNGSTIAAVTWTVPPGLTNEAVSNTTTTATIRISGGTPGESYTVLCLVTTAEAEDIEAQFTLTIVS